MPHCPIDAAAICRDKFGAREAFRLAAVPSAKCRLANTLSDARQAADEIGYPVVVKPRALCASFGVSLVGAESELAGAFASAQSSKLPEAWAHRDGVLVEEYLDGPEISVDSIVRDGRVTPVLYAKKLLGFAPFFEEIGHIVAPFDAVPEQQREIRDVIVRAHRALGIDNLTTHTEVRLTSRGPRIIEVNGRAGGDLIPYVGLLASGLDIGGASADVAIGVEPDIPFIGRGIGGIRFFYPSSAGRFQSAEMPLGYEQPPWLLEFTCLAEPGMDLKLVPGEYIFSRTGFAIVSGETFEECETRLEAVGRAVTVEVRAS
ncbi:MAG: ATP-grasp domain-containing protein [Geminicoccaceae bacterium]